MGVLLVKIEDGFGLPDRVHISEIKACKGNGRKVIAEKENGNEHGRPGVASLLSDSGGFQKIRRNPTHALQIDLVSVAKIPTNENCI